MILAIFSSLRERGRMQGGYGHSFLLNFILKFLLLRKKNLEVLKVSKPEYI